MSSTKTKRPIMRTTKQDRISITGESTPCKIVSTVFNVINNEHELSSIKDLIGLRNNNYNLRGSDILKQPKGSTTTYGLKSWLFMAPKLWKLLPDSSSHTLKAEHSICQVYYDDDFLPILSISFFLLVNILFTCCLN